MADSTPSLNLADLATAQPHLDAQLTAIFAQAASVCLDRHHESPILLSVREDETPDRAKLSWQPSTNSVRGSWGDQNDTIEWGAVGVALGFLGFARGLVATRRAQRGSGADYYLAPIDTPSDDLEGEVRLEVSGIDRGAANDLQRRLTRKLDQLRSGNVNAPGLAVVVGFSAGSIHLATLDPK